MKKLVFFTFLLMYNFSLAQVGINTDNSSPDASSMLDIKSTTSGLLIPRMSAIDRDNISSPATGLMVYVTDDNNFYYYDGTNWTGIQNSANTWLLNGNAGTSGSEFLGTTDAQPLIIKTNNEERMRIEDNGIVKINTALGSGYQLILESMQSGIKSEITIPGNDGGSNTFRGVYSTLYCDNADNRGFESYVSGDSYNYGNFNDVSGDDASNYGTYNEVYGDGFATNYGVYTDVLSFSATADNYGYYAKVTGHIPGNDIYGFYADLTGYGYGFYGNFKVDKGNGSIAYFNNTSDTGIGLISNGNNLSSIKLPDDGAGIVANGSKLGIIGYTALNDNDAVAVKGYYVGTTNTHATGVVGYSMPTASYGYGVKGYGGWIGVYGETDANGYAGVVGVGDEEDVYGVVSKGNFLVEGESTLNGELEVAADVVVRNDLYVDNDADIGRDLTVYDDLYVNNDANIEYLYVNNSADIGLDLTVYNDLYVNNNAGIGNDLTVDGDLNVSGTKNFKIDYPLDPANKFLKHFCIESNEVINLYRGNVILNSNGEATVKLPDYFRAINKNFSYVLTPIGKPSPNIYIAKEIDANGIFTIAGGTSGQKISWYVYAERNDPYMQQYPKKRQVVISKNKDEQGKYLMPELYNQPRSKRIGFSKRLSDK